MNRVCAALLVATASACGVQPPAARGQNWPEADRLFRNDPLWLGSDGAYSTDLGDGRVLWLFGDTLIARDASRNRNTAWFIRNSLAIETGYDPSRAFIQFYWGSTDGHPSSFFPEDGIHWFWPSGCARVGQGLIIFAQRLFQRAPGQFGFATDASLAFFIQDAATAPSTWQPVQIAVPDSQSGMTLGTAVMISGDWLIVYGTRGDTGNYVVARFAVSDAAAGDLSRGQFFTGGRWTDASAVHGLPDAIFDFGAPEASVNWEPGLGRFLITQTVGFGATTLAFRAASRPEGPWSEPRTFFRPPESFLPGAFVYAGKAHPELTGLGAGLVATYFPSTFSDTAPLLEPDDYYPRFVKVTF